MAQGNPLPGELYLHFKNKLYQVVSVAYHSETMERYVVYQALYGDYKTYIRPYDMFISEVDHEKYPDADQKYRFRYMGNTADEGRPESAKGQAGPAVNPDAEINPWLDRILDAESFTEKYKIVCDMNNDVTDRLIDDIAVVMDLAIPEGNLRERYAQLKQCIRTRKKYEAGRLR